MEIGHGPWHSVNSGIFHDNPGCQTGNSIAPENVRHGTGDGRLCDECARLNAAAASPVTGPAAAPAADPTGPPPSGGRGGGPPRPPPGAPARPPHPRPTPPAPLIGVGGKGAPLRPRPRRPRGAGRAVRPTAH